jgi:hypothetical protein
VHKRAADERIKGGEARKGSEAIKASERSERGELFVNGSE